MSFVTDQLKDGAGSYGCKNLALTSLPFSGFDQRKAETSDYNKHK